MLLRSLLVTLVLTTYGVWPVQADEPSFRRHTLNADSTFSACAAMDVNRDGKLDVVCGGWWYEAPDWKRHFLREVEVIRGRYDDYSNLPLDVNRDGWPDLVSVNYRSQSLYWVEHPGKALGEWRRHVIDTPGAMETGRLVDVDGDGRLDVLPNGVKFAAWWELAASDPDAGSAPRWIRHDLPDAIAGHGIGFGDINGDGRSDVVGPTGWAEAPLDRRRGRWVVHRDFSLDRDCSIPILVYDVDRDGDNDLVWGRGHRIGLYWLEQVAGDGQRDWRRHVIDTSWSQPHSLLLADVDQDQRPELVAGKRYMGHEGRDPGEYDPLVAYWYDFDLEHQTWRRGTISGGGPAGFGLDPKAVDLDADGDLDFLASGRSGLYWFENLLANKQGVTPTRPPQSPDYADHKQLTHFQPVPGEIRAISSAAELAVRRQHILAGMTRAMGPLPDSSRRVPLDMKRLESVDTDKYVRHRIRFDVEPGDQVPAYLLIPKGLDSPAPAMLCLHQTTRIGKDEPAGQGGRPTLHYAHELAERGFVCIVPDYPSFGEYDYDFATDGQHYESGSMKAIWNNLRAIDLLEALPEVHRDRIGCIGHSLGGHNTLFTAAFDQRIRAVVTSCGFTAFHHYYGGKLAGWTSDRYMPRIRDVYHNDPDQVPFDFYEVLAAIAPRAVFINAPIYDSNFDVTGVKKAVKEVSRVYQLRDASDQLSAHYPDSRHDFPDEIRQRAYDWLQQKLR